MSYVIIPGENPLEDNLILRDLSNRQNTELSFEEVVYMCQNSNNQSGMLR